MPANLKDIISDCKTCSIPTEAKKDLCSICITQKLTRGKWTLVILWLLRDGEKRFSKLNKEIPQIKQGPLTLQLKELAEVGLINRKAYNEIPPKVEYSLTQKGKEFLNVMEAMDTWGKGYFKEVLKPNMIS